MTVKQDFSHIREAVAAWSSIRQFLRSGDDQGNMIPVVIPKDKRGLGWINWVLLGLYCLGIAAYGLLSGSVLLLGAMAPLGLLLIAIGGLSYWGSVIVVIEQGTSGILSRFGKVEKTLEPGRHFLFSPWEKVEYIVDTSTEIPYSAPVLACPTQENVPLKSIEFFLKFRIVDPVKFVRNIGASNFDVVISSVVQDALRRRSRSVQTERAYELRGSDVGDMQVQLNQQLARYGVQITGANIPDVQLPDQYQQNLATKERVAKELTAYEKEWELIQRRRTDSLKMEIERAKKERDEKLIAVQEAVNRAREDVAQMIQEHEAEAEKVRLNIEARGRAELKSAENEARALASIGKSYQDNQAVLRYQLAQRKLAVARNLMQQAPRPVIINGESQDNGALSMLLMAQMLPNLQGNGGTNGHQEEQSWQRRALLQQLTASNQPNNGS